jgi:predicted TIM-barrel fold metal-dependent hydrolase
VGSLAEWPIADAHLHVWDAKAHYYPWLSDLPVAFRYGDYSTLPRCYRVEDYRRDAAAWNVVRGVYVEAEWDPGDPIGEMDFIAEVRREHDFPTVAIAQAWLDREDCAALLETHARRTFVRGVRHKPKPEQLHDARWRAGYARLAPLGLHFELQAPWRQLGEAASLARAFADTRIVLNHTGLPHDDELAGWRDALTGLAVSPNVAIKISGLGTVARKKEVVLAAIELFGTHRTMFASNYPVDGLCERFDTIWRTFDDITRGFAEHERRALFYDNAVRIYRME